VLKEIWAKLFGSKEKEATLNINLNIKVKDLDRFVEVLSKISHNSNNNFNNRDIIEEREVNNKNQSEERQIINKPISEKKKHLSEDPITAKDVAEIFNSTGIQKGVDKTGSDLYSHSKGSSTDNQVSSLKKLKKKGNQNG